MLDTYHTIKSPTEGIFRDRGSKFIAYAFPVFNESDWQDALSSVKKLHPKARHHCYAYRIGTDKNNYRANDDGEPSGTAGRPILGRIDSYGLSNVIVIVVRYFGGTLLGASGLINAYKESTHLALETAKIIEKKVKNIYAISFDYSLMSDVMNAIKKLNIEITHQEFEISALIKIAIQKSLSEETLNKLRATIAKVRMDEEEIWKNIPGLEIEFQQTI